MYFSFQSFADSYYVFASTTGGGLLRIWRSPRAGKGYVWLGERSGKPLPSAWVKRSVCLGFETLRTGKLRVGLARGNRRILQATPKCVPSFPHAGYDKNVLLRSVPVRGNRVFPPRVSRENLARTPNVPRASCDVYAQLESFPRTGNPRVSPSVSQPFPYTNSNRSLTQQWP